MPSHTVGTSKKEVTANSKKTHKNRKSLSRTEYLITEESPDKMDASVVEINLCQADVDLLVIYVTFDSEKSCYFDCMVDSDAGVSLISTAVLPHLTNVQLIPSTEIKAISGFGHSPKLKIEHYVELPMIFESGFTTDVISFFVVPIEHMTHHLVLGAASLKKNNLSLDLTNRELVHRDADKLAIVAKDISNHIPFYKCVTINTIVVPPHTCKMVPVKISTETSEDIGAVWEFVGNGLSSVFPISGIIDFREVFPRVAVLNASDREQYLRKNTSVGQLRSVTKDVLATIGHTNVDLDTTDTLDDWTTERITTEFQIAGLPITKHQKELVIKTLLHHTKVLSRGEHDVGLTKNITHSIELETDRPVRIPVRRFQGPLAQEIEKECAKLLANHIIQPSKSPYSAPVVPVRKPDGSLR